MGKKARMIAHAETPPESRTRQQPAWTVSTRCRATHDVPYTLRCVLPKDHTLIDTEHRDKDGRIWTDA
jgi:hypothetical protein